MSRPSCRVVAPPGAQLAEVVARLVPDSAEALADGRVFVDGKRAGDAQLALRAGALVELYARRGTAGEVEILATHGGLVFVAKPAGIATEPDHAGIDDSLLARTERLLGAQRGELHAVSRLDVGVSGVVTLARGATARALVEELRARGRFERRYLGLAGGEPAPDGGTWSAAVGKQRDGRRSVGGASAKPATTRYRVVARAAGGVPGVALLALSPLTGRTHQLRVHASAAGAPLLGDRSYGGASRARLASGRVISVARPALHALWVELGLEAGPLRVEAPVPEDFAELWVALGGAPEALERAGDAELAPDPRTPTE
jgi:23S rRNA-/tRNA-specific pseudouridylate synthase